MSFKYGDVDTADLPGVTATLSRWPSLGGLTVQNANIPGGNGRVFGGSTRERTVLTFDVIIEGANPIEVGQARDTFVSLIDPSRGPRPLQVEADPEWLWLDVLVSQEIEWERMTWDKGLGYRLRGDVEFETQRAAGAVEAEPRAYSGDGEVTFTVEQGNTASYPRLEFNGGGDITVTVNDYTLELTDVPAGHIGVLDWDTFTFRLLTASGERAGSFVRNLSNFERPTLYPGQPVTETVTGPAGGIPFYVYPNSRRI